VADRLSARLRQPGLVTAPGVFDMISAKVADAMGFDALYMTGYGVVASHLGLPDAGLATYTDMVGRVRQIAGGTTTPLIADGDTGYGGLLNVDFAVRGYEAAGAQAIQIEDQEFPKKCGTRRIAASFRSLRRPAASGWRRMRARPGISSSSPEPTRAPRWASTRRCAAARPSLKRGRHTLRRVTRKREEMRRIGEAFDLPLLANMVEGGRTPILTRAELEAFGFKIAIFPTAGFLAAASALRSVYGELKNRGSSKEWSGEFYPFADFTRLMGSSACGRSNASTPRARRLPLDLGERRHV